MGDDRIGSPARLGRLNMLHRVNLPILPALVQSLADLGDGTPIVQIIPVSGGCIHQVFQLITKKRAYLLKWNPAPQEGMFEVEARGLKLLAASDAIRVPQVLAVNSQPAFILLEWIDPAGHSSGWDQERLGHQLAALHRSAAPQAYGLDHDNYIGSISQINSWRPDWVTFFRENRLHPQIKLSVEHEYLSGAQLHKLSRICDHLDRWIDEHSVQPSLLHGDLWAGNVLCGPAGLPVLIDPAVYYGDREAELAFTGLFGGFTARFYQAYNESWPLDPGNSGRRDLYNLYHLLNHLNIFGPVYLRQVSTIIDRYAGG